MRLQFGQNPNGHVWRWLTTFDAAILKRTRFSLAVFHGLKCPPETSFFVSSATFQLTMERVFSVKLEGDKSFGSNCSLWNDDCIFQGFLKTNKDWSSMESHWKIITPWNTIVSIKVWTWAIRHQISVTAMWIHSIGSHLNQLLLYFDRTLNL